MAPDGKRLLMDQPEAKAGIRNYYSLVRFMRNEYQPPVNPWVPFLEGEAAVGFLGPWLMYEQQHQEKIHSNLGVAVIPGVPFVGGTNLVVWKHTRHPDAAVKLINFLTRLTAKFPYTTHNTLFPARVETIETLKKNANPFINTCIQSIQQGHGLTNRRVWGYVEDRLTLVLKQIWDALLADPTADLDSTIQDYLDPFIKRTNLSLSS